MKHKLENYFRAVGREGLKRPPIFIVINEYLVIRTLFFLSRSVLNMSTFTLVFDYECAFEDTLPVVSILHASTPRTVLECVNWILF